jgi:phosphohistidine phosphatase
MRAEVTAPSVCQNKWERFTGMEIYLLRHGVAEDAHPGASDAERALTAEGRKKLLEVLRVAKAAGVRPSLILTSPYRRAVETAEIARFALGAKSEPLRTRALQPMAAPENLWDELRVHKDEPRVLLAGHEPMLSQTAGYLLGVPELNIDFKKGTLVRLDVEQFGPRPSAVLKWMLVPRLAAATL